VLDQILHSTRQRIAALRPQRPQLRAAAEALPAGRSLAAALAEPGMQVIAEIKRRSPSAGAIDLSLDPGDRAQRYVAGGAAAISVLTEPEFFGGSVADLRAVRAAVDVPILRKDFLLDVVQLHEAKVNGADAVLLIVAALEEGLLAELLAAAAECGLDALVEAHNQAELTVATNCGAQLIGINNRDLRTFVTDLATAEALAPSVADTSVKVAESGVSSPAGARRMAAAGYDAILVGEALVRSSDPKALVAELRGGT